ncbi:MAG TPA: hypothetical protein VF234_07225, partial [Limnochordia bacterium]
CWKEGRPVAEAEIENKSTTKRRRGNPAWRKGVSGNPGGRPRVAAEFRERCREFMTAGGWARLVALATDPESPHHYRALEMIAHYAYGKPTQPVSGEDGRPLGIVVLPAPAQEGDGG